VDADIIRTNASLRDGPFAPAGDSAVVTAHAWYVMGLMAAVYMLAALDRSVLSVLIEPVRAEFKLNDSQLGFVAGLAFGLPCGLMAIPFGLLIDRVNRRAFLSIILGLWSFLTALGGIAQNYIQLVLSRMAVGTAEAGVPAAHSIITDYFPAEKRPMALGFVLGGGSIAYMITFAIGGWVAQNWGWRYVFFIVGLPGIIVALTIFLTVREPMRGAMEKSRAAVEPAPPLWETLGHLFSLRSFLHLYIGYALISASVSSFWSWISSLLIRVHGLPIQDAGITIALAGGIGGPIGNVLGALLAGRLGRNGVAPVITFVGLASLAVAPLGITMSLTATLALVIAIMPFVAGLKNGVFGPLQGVMLTLAKVRMRGVTAGLFHVTGTLVGFGVGPLISGVISHAMGGGEAIRYGLAACFLFDAWAAVHFWRGRRILERDLRTVGGLG
jgi:predicted MFS family arabinose efflux permease